MKIAIVTPSYAPGGVKTITSKLYEGLKNEGYYVELVVLKGDLISRAYNDLGAIRRKLIGFDASIYMGSKVWLSHLFIQSKKALFIHGFISDEFISAIKHRNLRGILGAIPLLANLKVLNSLKTWDFFICHSKTTCEVNGINKDYVLLPQFVLPNEIDLYTKLSNCEGSNSIVKITMYTSFTESSRLLRIEDIVSFAKKLNKQTNRKFSITIIAPGSYIKSTSLVKIIDYLPKSEFLRMLASSDIYIERCVDEELGYATIEAGLIGVPVAKITHPKYLTRQDYSNEELILATSREELIVKMAEYINNVDYYKEYYRTRIRRFMINERSWNKVKKPLLRKISN